MSRKEMISIVRILCNGGYEEEDDDLIMVDKLRSVLPHAKISDLIFHDFRNLTPEEIVDEAIKKELDYIASHGSNSSV